MAEMKGYCWPLSATPGETIEFFTSTNAKNYTVQYVRFKNERADVVTDDVISNGGEIVEIPISSAFARAGRQQDFGTPAEGATDWEMGVSLSIPREWISGVFAAKCVDDSSTFYVPFIVKPDPSQRNPLMVLANTNTWNAYNPEFGYSRYSAEVLLGHPLELSFLRPHQSLFNLGMNDDHNTLVGYPYGFTSKHQLRGELWVLSWLEQSGYRADVFTDLDFHEGVEGIADYKAIILTTHPEYWSQQMYRHLRGYLDVGGRLLYLGGNGLFDSVTISDDLKVMTVYGAWSKRTRLLSQIGLPEGELLGVATPVFDNHDATLQAAGNQFVDLATYRVNEPDPVFGFHRFFLRTHLGPGDEFGQHGWYLPAYSDNPGSIETGGASGGECDRRNESSPPNIQLLAKGENSRIPPGEEGITDTPPFAEMIYYDHPCGGFVFSVGSISFGGSLVMDEHLQQILYNALDECLGWLDPTDTSDVATQYAAIWHEKDGTPWEARHGISRDDFQTTYDDLLTQGYRLICWSGHSVEGEDRYAAVWQKRTGPPWEADYLMTADGFQANYDERVGRGYRLVQVFGYTSGGEQLYGSLWEMRPGPDWKARYGLTADDFQAAYDELVGDGYRLVYLSAFGIDSEARYCAIWEESDAETPVWDANYGLTPDEFQRRFVELKDAGYRLVHIWGYAVGDEDRYLDIWEQSDGPTWEARLGLTASEYRRALNQLSDQGYRPVVVSGFRKGGYAA